MCINLNDKNYINENNKNTDIENPYIDNKNTNIENPDNKNQIPNKKRISFSNIFKYTSTKKSITRQPSCNMLDSIYICNYCKRNCTLEIYRFMDNSYCSRFCRNQIIPRD
jgi:hypothetical protein